MTHQTDSLNSGLVVIDHISQTEPVPPEVVAKIEARRRREREEQEKRARGDATPPPDAPPTGR